MPRPSLLATSLCAASVTPITVYPRVYQGGWSEADCVLGDDGTLYGVIRNEAGDATGWDQRCAVLRPDIRRVGSAVPIGAGSTRRACSGTRHAQRVRASLNVRAW
jgi:hypothetical protein